MKRSHWIALSVVAALGVAATLGYFAYEHFEDHDYRERMPASYAAAAKGAQGGAPLTLEAALRIAQAEVPGEVIKVERDREHGVDVIEIKVLAATGRVREITLDAHSGAVLELEDD